MARLRVAAVLGPALACGWLLLSCLGEDPEGTTPATTNPRTDDAGAGADTSSSSGDGAVTDTQAGPRCNPTSPFGAPTLVQALSTSGEEYWMWLSPDEKTAYVSRSPIAADDPDIYVSVRPSREDPFPEAIKISTLDALNTDEAQSQFSLTSGETALYLHRQPGGGLPELQVAARASKTEAFAAPVSVFVGGAPATNLIQPFISRDGATLYFHNLTDHRIYAATRATSVTSFATPIDALGPTSVDSNLCPVVTSDGLRLYFASFRAANVGGIGNSDVWTATRAGGDIFGTVENAGTINSEADDTPTAVTDDGCILYFVSKRAGGAGGSDIWSAKRGL
jgi:hypothetical protein